MKIFKLTTVLLVSSLILASCNNATENSNQASADSLAIDSTAVLAVADVVYVLPAANEKTVAGIHMSKKHHEHKIAGKPTEEVDAETDFETVPLDIFVAALADSDIVPMAPAPVDSITTTLKTTELNDTQTVVELGKRGQSSMLQVVSDPNDPNKIDQIVYVDKRHVDVYNVQAGMNAKEVKKLRKEMKHMVRKGKVFMYEDNSNIMYQMTSTDALTKKSYTDSEVDEMTVDAIVWQNKSDKKNTKKSN